MPTDHPIDLPIAMNSLLKCPVNPVSDPINNAIHGVHMALWEVVIH